MSTSRRMYLLRPAATSSSSMLVLRAFCGGLCARRSIANGHAATCSKKCPLADSSRSLVHADHPWLLESFPARCQTSVHSACACLAMRIYNEVNYRAYGLEMNVPCSALVVYRVWSTKQVKIVQITAPSCGIVGRVCCCVAS